MENGVVDHLWLALRKSKHEIANGEWRLALEKTQYQKKQDSLTDSPLSDRSVFFPKNRKKNIEFEPNQLKKIHEV